MSDYAPIRENAATGPSSAPCGAVLSLSDKQALVSFFELLIEADKTQRRKRGQTNALEQG
jgi:hypothetical protein